MTDEEQQEVRGHIASRLKWMTGDRLRATAEAAGVNVAGVLRHLAHPHSEDAGRPWLGDGSDWSDMAREDAELNRISDERKDGPFVKVTLDTLNTDRAQVAEWGKGR